MSDEKNTLFVDTTVVADEKNTLFENITVTADEINTSFEDTTVVADEKTKIKFNPKDIDKEDLMRRNLMRRAAGMYGMAYSSGLDEDEYERVSAIEDQQNRDYINSLSDEYKQLYYAYKFFLKQ